MKALLTAIALSLVAPGLTAQGSPPVRASIAQLSWLAGAWTGGGGPLSIEERWGSPAGGTMLGVSQTIKGDQMVAFEFLRIAERDGTLVYIAQPNGRPPTEFRLATITADSATFENKAHDFPKVIAYTKKSDGTLEARVSDGGQKGETFSFRRTQTP